MDRLTITSHASKRVGDKRVGLSRNLLAKAAHAPYFVPFAQSGQKRYLCRMPDEIPSIEVAKAAIAELKQQGLSIAEIARSKGKSGRHSLQLESPDMRCYVVRLAKRYGWKP